MGLPISLSTNRSWLVALMDVQWLGPLVIFAIATLPAVAAFALFTLFRFFAWALDIHHNLTEEWVLAGGLLAAAPWNLALYRRAIRIRLLWIPAWLFCLVMGTFGAIKASGLLPR